MIKMAEEKETKGKDIGAKAPEPSEEGFKHLVRIANTDLDGSKPLGMALRKIKGVNFQFANMVCTLANIDAKQETGLLKDDQINRLDEVVKDPSKFGAPVWMLNRRRDYETNEDNHLLLSDLDLTKENDIKRLKKKKAYRGTRNMQGLPSRGQRTKSNFRRTKTKGGPKIGVVKKRAKAGRV